MVEREFEPTVKPLSTLGYWAFRNNSLMFAGSSADREILLRYYSLSAGIVNDVKIVVNLNNVSLCIPL